MLGGRSHHVVLLPVYGASEALIEGAESSDLMVKIQKNNSSIPVDLLSKTDVLAGKCQDFLFADDILLMQGAGDVGSLALSLAEKCLVEKEGVLED